MNGTKHALAIDPGLSTGIVMFSWGDDRPFQRVAHWQFGGGAEGLRDWLNEHGIRVNAKRHFTYSAGQMPLEAIVAERFTPKQSGTFNLTEGAVEPLRCEGALIARADRDAYVWQRPAAQYFMGGGTPAERKKRSRDFLKKHDLHLTGSMIEPSQPDADDAISATLHAIAFLRVIKHLPTLERFFS